MVRHTRILLFLVLFALAIIPGLLVVQPVDAQIVGTNWVGTVYNNTTLSGTPVATNVPYPTGLCLNWGNNAPTAGSNTLCALGNAIGGVGADNFSISFTSTQNFDQSGNYTFTLRYNDGLRLYVNNVVVYDQFTQLSAPDTSGDCASLCHEARVTVNIAAGAVPLRVDYVEYSGNALIQVQWAFGGGGGGSTPTGPTVTPVPIATGTVIRVRGLAIRTGPYLGASLVGVARPNISYPILERNSDEGLFIWYKIKVGDNAGWVSGRYFQTAGNIEAIPFTQTIFDQIDGAPDKGVVGVTRSVMNLRRRPSERATLLDKVPWGAEVPVIGRTIQGGNNFWLQVIYNGKVGWIYAPFVGLRGIVDAVPIR